MLHVDCGSPIVMVHTEYVLHPRRTSRSIEHDWFRWKSTRKKKKNPQTSKIRLHICGRANVSAYAGNLKVMTESNVGKKSESNHENIRNWVFFCLFQIFSKRLSTWTLTMLVLE